MAIIGWGKYKAEFSKLDSAGAVSSWTEFGVIKEGTGLLTSEEGTKLEAPGEGGEMVAVKYQKATPVWNHTLYIKKGDVAPINDNDGQVEGEYAFRITPEDPTVEGVYMPRCSVYITYAFGSAMGKEANYRFTGLKPTTGNMLQSYWAAIAASPTSLSFTDEADAVGKVITILSGGGAASVTSSEAWATATVSGTSVTVKVSANVGIARTAFVTITRDGVSAVVNISQEAA